MYSIHSVMGGLINHIHEDQSYNQLDIRQVTRQWIGSDNRVSPIWRQAII